MQLLRPAAARVPAAELEHEKGPEFRRLLSRGGRPPCAALKIAAASARVHGSASAASIPWSERRAPNAWKASWRASAPRQSRRTNAPVSRGRSGEPLDPGIEGLGVGDAERLVGAEGGVDARGDPGFLIPRGRPANRRGRRSCRRRRRGWRPGCRGREATGASRSASPRSCPRSPGPSSSSIPK